MIQGRIGLPTRMDLLAERGFAFAPPKAPRTLAATGVILGVAALLMAVCAPAFLEAKDPPAKDLPHVLADSAAKIKDRLAHKEIQTETVKRLSWSSALTLVGAITGFLGTALGTASWVRREHVRLSSLAIAAGLTAIAWNYFVLAVIASIGLFLLAWIISHFR